MAYRCAVRETSSVVHLLTTRDGTLRTALCGFVPDRDWFRLWEQSFDSEPIGLCKACWNLRAESIVRMPSREPTSAAP